MWTKEQRRDYERRNRARISACRKAIRDKRRAETGFCYDLAGHRKTRYGVTEKQFAELLEACGNKCPVCRRKFSRTPAVDHCHNTGVIRGLICHDCNSAEGFLRTPENALRLYEYMLRNELFYQKTN